MFHTFLILFYVRHFNIFLYQRRLYFNMLDYSLLRNATNIDIIATYD